MFVDLLLLLHVRGLYTYWSLEDDLPVTRPHSTPGVASLREYTTLRSPINMLGGEEEEQIESSAEFCWFVVVVDMGARNRHPLSPDINRFLPTKEHTTCSRYCYC